MERISQAENRRRRSKFTLSRHRYLLPALIGSIAGALAVHFLIYHLLIWCGYSFDVSSHDQIPQSSSAIERIVALSSEDKNEAPPPEIPEPEEVAHEPLPEPEPLDPDDFNPEEVVIAPGETDLGQSNEEMISQMALESLQSQMDIQKIKEGMPNPSEDMIAPVTANPVTIPAVPGTQETDPDEWYREKLKGAGGKDDSNLPDGAKSFEQLLSQKQGSLGKGSGHARIGADLLFEYNKAVMRNSARIGLLQLASLICKNPATTFVIEGHSDSFGSEQYNYLLSLMRANAVRLWLQDNGISLKNIYVRGCGAARPVVSLKGDKDAQAANRRVEIHMRKKGEDVPDGSKPSNFKIDMATPISAQLAAMTPDEVNKLKPASKPLPSPSKEPQQTKPSSKPAVHQPLEKKPKVETPSRGAPPALPLPAGTLRKEHIPVAEPLDEPIPHAEEVIPDAIPL